MIVGDVEFDGVDMRSRAPGTPDPLTRYKCPLGIWIDTPEERISRQALTTWAAGKLTIPSRDKELDGWEILENMHVEPFEGTLMKLPASRAPQWLTSNIAPFNKLLKADYDLSEPDNWTDIRPGGAYEYWMAGSNLSVGSTATTKLKAARNQGFMLASYAYGAVGTAHESSAYMRVKWLKDGVPFAVAFDFYRSGKVELLYTIGSDVTIYTGGSVSLAGQRKANQDVTQRSVNVMLVPFRRNEFLIESSEGAGGIFACPWIAEDDPDPEITPNAKVQIEFLVAGRHSLISQFQQWVASGKATAIKTTFKKPPDTSEALNRVRYRDQPQVGAQTVTMDLVDPVNTVTIFVPDGIKTEARTQISITGDTNSTEFILGTVCWYDAKTDVCGSTEVDITDEVSDTSLEWGEHPRDHRAGLSAWNPADSAADNLATRFNRPADIRLCSFIVARGPLKLNERERLYTAPEAEELPLAIGSVWDHCEIGQFDEVVPFDDLTITDAFKLVGKYAGLGSRLRVSEDPFRLECGKAVSSHEFAMAAMPGDKFAHWFDRLRDDYCATWWMGLEMVEEDVPRLAILKPEDLEAEPAITLYLSEADAIADGVDPALSIQTRRYLIRHGWKDAYLKPEANDIWITGFDPRKSQPILMHRADLDSQDMTLDESLRPINWLGEIAGFELQDPAIATQAVLERATNIAFDRLTVRRRIATVTAGWWFDKAGLPMVAGRAIRVRRQTSLGVWEETKWRIKKLKMQSLKEPKSATAIGSEGWMLRNVNYVLEEIGEDEVTGADLKMSGWDASVIQARQIRASFGNVIQVNRTRAGDSPFVKGLAASVTHL